MGGEVGALGELVETEDTKVRDLLIGGKLRVRENASGLRDRLEVRGYRRPVGCSARLFAKFPLDDPFLEPGEARFAGYRPVYVHGRFVRLKDANKTASELDKMRSCGAEARPKAQRYAPGSDPAHTPTAKAAPAAPKGPPKGLPEQFASRWGSMYEADKASATASQQETPPIKTANAAGPARRQVVAAASTNTGRVRTGRQGGAAASNERAGPGASAGDAQTQAALDRQRQAATGFVPRRSFREVVHDPAAERAARAAEAAVRARQEQEERRVAEIASAEERSRAKAKERQEIERARTQAEDAEKQVAASTTAAPVSAPAPVEVEEVDPLALLEARPFESLSNTEKTQLMLLRRQRASTGFVPARRPAYRPGADGAAAELPPQAEPASSPGTSTPQRPARGGGEDVFGGDTRVRMARKPRLAKVPEASASMDDFFGGSPAAAPAKDPPAPAANLDDLLGPAPAPKPAPKAVPEADERPWIPETMRGKPIDPRTEAALKKRWEASTGFTPSRRPSYQPAADGQALAAPAAPSSDAPVSRSPRGASGAGMDSLFGGGGDTRVRMPSRKKREEPT